MPYVATYLGYAQFSFWIPISLSKICFSHIVINYTKNTSVLEGIVLKKIYPEVGLTKNENCVIFLSFGTFMRQV